MQAASRLQTVLKAGKSPAFGAWQMLPGANHARIMARSGFDWILVDTEHGNIDDAQMHEAVGAIAACGVSPIVRVAANEGWMVKRVLDAGAHGILVPLIDTAEDARKMVEAAKYPPMGKRGFGAPFALEAFGNPSTTDYFLQSNDVLITAVQIETKSGLENVDAIAKVPGIDVLLVGPYDLGNNIGYPPAVHGFLPELDQAIDRILKAAVDNGKKAAIYCSDGASAKKYADKGFHMLSVTSDVSALPKVLSETLKTAKGA